MMNDKKQLNNLIKKHNAKFVSFKFIGPLGALRQLDKPVDAIDLDQINIDGYNLAPILDTAFIDPFKYLITLNVLCYIRSTEHDSRSFLTKADKLVPNILLEAKIDFYIYDSLTYSSDEYNNSLSIKSSESNVSNTAISPFLCSDFIDCLGDIRAEIVDQLQKTGIKVSSHYHGQYVNQCVIEFEKNNLVKLVDQLFIAKYVIRNVVHTYGKAVSFMPKLSPNTENTSYFVLTYDKKYNIKKITNNIQNLIKALCLFTNLSHSGYNRLYTSTSYSINKILFNEKENNIKISFIDLNTNLYLAMSSIIVASAYETKKSNKNLLLDFPCCLSESIIVFNKNKEFINNISCNFFVRNYISYLEKVSNMIKFYLNSKEFEIFNNI